MNQNNSINDPLHWEILKKDYENLNPSYKDCGIIYFIKDDENSSTGKIIRNNITYGTNSQIDSGSLFEIGKGSEFTLSQGFKIKGNNQGISFSNGRNSVTFSIEELKRLKEILNGENLRDIILTDSKTQKQYLMGMENRKVKLEEKV